jgi:hypothetical protein
MLVRLILIDTDASKCFNALLAHAENSRIAVLGRKAGITKD